MVSEIGSVVELTRNDIRLNGSVPSGSVMIDGNSVGEIGDVVLRDRKLLAEEGLFTVVILLKKKTGELAAPAEVISRGFDIPEKFRGTGKGGARARNGARRAIPNGASFGMVFHQKQHPFVA